MKFRGDVCNVALFLRLCSALSKIAKNAVLQLSPKTLRFVLTTAFSDGMELWSGMNMTTLFENIIIDSLAADKSITLRITLEILEKALRSGQTALKVVAKLKKRNGNPVLSFVAEQKSPNPMTITQDVPVTVLPSSFMRGITEPSLPNPDVFLFLPPIKALRNVIEHFKNVAYNATLTATISGSFSISVNTTSASILSTFSGLQHPDVSINPSAATSNGQKQGGSESTQQADSPMVVLPNDNPVSAKVNISKMLRLLQCHIVQPNAVICCIVQNRSVVFHAILDDLYLTYYLPVLI